MSYDHTPTVITDVSMTLRPDAPIDEICQLLVKCEQAQHRYQWASGMLIVSLLDRPEVPKNMREFVNWLADRTNMVLTQNEIRRRLEVHRFYSRFADERIIELIQNGGVHMAHRARRAIKGPEQAREVLEACIERPGAMDEVLQRFAEPRHRRSKNERYVRVSLDTIDRIRDKLIENQKHLDGEDCVALTLVLDLLSGLTGQVDQKLETANVQADTIADVTAQEAQITS